jgi:hypothetical protein
MPTPSTRTPVRIARGSYSNLNGSVSDLQDGEISYAEDQNKLYIKEGSSLVALTYTPASPAFTGTITGVNLTLSGNLTVNGTTTTINTQTLDVEDKNVVIGKVSSPSDTTADGGGWTLKGSSDKTFNWVNATDSWTSSESIHLGDAKKIYFGTGQDFLIEHNGTSGFVWNTTGDTVLRGSGNGWINIQPKTGEAGIVVKPDNATELYYDNSKKIETTAAGVTVTGSVTDDKGNVRHIIRSVKSSAYTLVSDDSGKCIYISSGGVTVNANVFGTAGHAVTIVNDSGSDQTITQGSGLTIYNTADAATGNRTLAGRGMATIWFASGTTAYISGAGLS